MVEPLALEQNLALMAGAGAGKTHALMTMCLHLLGGARAQREPLRPSQLFLLTFTDKAAAEMRERLRQRLDRLAGGTLSDEDEPELRQSFSRLGKQLPSASYWRAVRDDLGSATIGTFHSLCIQLLRRAPGGVGVDPAFEILDEGASVRLLQQVAERLVLERVESGDPDVTELCRELRFKGTGYIRGLVNHLAEVFAKVREEGTPPERLPTTDGHQARAEFDQALERVRMAAVQARAADLAGKGAFAETLQRACMVLEGMHFDNVTERLPSLKATAAINLQRAEKGIRDALKAFRTSVLGDSETPGIADFHAACVMARYEKTVCSLLGALEQRYREELRNRTAMDFSELLVQSRDLLRNHLGVRREAQVRMGALLVDECQDTNRLQLELITLLAERREGGPRPAGDLPLEPAFLCAVGDRKQSIYEFRGADVSVFTALAEKIVQEGGSRSFLKRNWRSSPALLSFFNRVFAPILGPKEDNRDYEVAYRPSEDDLDPVRPQVSQAPSVERLIAAEGLAAEEDRLLDAQLVARRLQHLLAPQAPSVVVEKDGSVRRARGGDVAILFRRFTYLEVYRQALIAHGIPHRVIRGRGFYGAQEVLDVASWLSLLADSSDAIAFAAVLRSPWVGLSDASLFRLAAWGNNGRLSLPEVQASTLAAASLPEEDGALLNRFLQLYPKIRREKDRLTLRELLHISFEETQYRVLVAGTPYGEQALANLDKLLDLAERWDAQGEADCAAFSRELLELASRDPTEAQADVLDAQDDRAVQLMTIHQAKGLEFPVVMVPDLGAPPKQTYSQFALERTLGLAIRPWTLDGKDAARPPRFRRILSEVGRKEGAEYLRLLYVALTRARDLLVLSGRGRSSRTWRHQLDREIEGQPSLRVAVRDVSLDNLPELAAVPPPEDNSPAAKRNIEAVVQRVRGRSEATAESVVLPVTFLQDFFLCPRRYLYARQVGLSEFPLAIDLDSENTELESGRRAEDPRFQGTLAHRLLERVDLSLRDQPERLRSHLEEQVWAEGVDPHHEGTQDIFHWVEEFLATGFVERISRAPHRLRRELPFLLKLGGGPGQLALHLKGQIDLLWEDEEGRAVVVDYKATRRHAAGLEPYAFQLDCYALAARQVLPAVRAAQTGVVFLRDTKREPEFHPQVQDAHLEQRLIQGAMRLLELTRRSEWPGLELAQCQALGCGYQYRCYGAVPAL